MMNKPTPWDDQVDLVSSDDEAVDMEADGGPSDQKRTTEVVDTDSHPALEGTFEGT